MFFELNGQPREVTVLDKSLKVETSQRAKADPTIQGTWARPFPEPLRR